MILQVITGILSSCYQLLSDMAPYLVFGFLFAGILNEFISTDRIARHLGRRTLGSVVKAALFGIPLPLCSCGVIPPTMTLRKSGASRGAVLSFLIATPTTGVDSIFATYSLLGPVFAVYRVIASFVAAVFSGLAANLIKGKEHRTLQSGQVSSAGMKRKVHSWTVRVRDVLHYAFVELLGEIGKWLVIGILIGGVIAYAIPDQFFNRTLNSGWQAILLMLVIGIPIYVCATGSIPIAAALMFKGLNPGAAFVFLLAGPATNAVTLTVITRYLGKKTTAIYLVTLILSSIGLGLLLDAVWSHLNVAERFPLHSHHRILPLWFETVTALFLIAMLLARLASFIRARLRAPEKIVEQGHEFQSTFLVSGMSCQNCAVSIEKALSNVHGVAHVAVDIHHKTVEVRHDAHIPQDQLIKAIEETGYTAATE